MRAEPAVSYLTDRQLVLVDVDVDALFPWDRLGRAYPGEVYLFTLMSKSMLSRVGWPYGADLHKLRHGGWLSTNENEEDINASFPCDFRASNFTGKKSSFENPKIQQRTIEV